MLERLSLLIDRIHHRREYIIFNQTLITNPSQSHWPEYLHHERLCSSLQLVSLRERDLLRKLKPSATQWRALNVDSWTLHHMSAL